MIEARSTVAMDTLVTIQVVCADDQQDATQARLEQALGWFAHIESVCTRFDADSELMRLCATTDVAVPVSALLFEAVHFALTIAEETGGAFDPTIGRALASSGFNRNYLSGATIDNVASSSTGATYRDVIVDPGRRTIALARPLILDLGAVVKGLAIDMAVCELRPHHEHFAIDAGGDLFLAGTRADGAPWRVGIRHPRADGEVLETLTVTNRAICTSGDYERISADGTRHILDPRAGTAAATCASVSVLAETAMLADAAATAAFVLGPGEGLQFLDRLGLDGVIVTPALERLATRGMRGDDVVNDESGHGQPDVDSGAAILPHAEGTTHHHPGDDSRGGGAG